MTEAFRQGRVVSITGERSTVSSAGKEYSCVLRKKAKGEKSKQKNILVVGDIVQFFLEKDTEGVIEKIEERKSYLTRQDTVQKKNQILAANVDQVLITVSVVNPPLKLPLIDRYLIACEKGNLSPILVINKIDLLNDTSYTENIIEKENLLYKEALFAYEQIGVPVCPVSAKKDEGLNALKKLMKGKTSVFSGQSGTGKSSLINAIFQTDLLVNAPIKRTRKGAHTTTRATLVPLKDEGFVVDTPGIKSFGIWELTKEDIIEHFTDIKEIGRGCRFSDCMHMKEPGCKVAEAIVEKKLSSLRFDSYLSLIESIGKKDRWR